MSEADTVPPIAAGVGADLRAAREQAGWTLPQVAAALRIRLAYLEALEEGRIGLLPGNAYAVAFMRSYAKILGLDPEEIVRRFRREAAEVNERTELEFPAPLPERGIPAGAIVVVGLVIAIGGYAVWWHGGGAPAPAPQVASVPAHLAAIAQPSKSAGGIPPAFAPGATGTTSTTATSAPDATGDAAPGSAGTTTPGTQSAANASTPAATKSPGPGQGVASARSPAANPAITGTQAATTAAGTGPATGTQATTDGSRATASAQASDTNQAAPVTQTATATPTQPPADASPASALASTLGTSAAAAAAQARANTIVLGATADAWLEVRDPSGTVLLNRVLHKGDTWTVPDQKGLVLTTGNAGGTTITVGTLVIPSLGGNGAVRRNLPLDPAVIRAGGLAANATPPNQGPGQGAPTTN